MKKYRLVQNIVKEIRQEIYYIRKFGLESHLKKRNIDIEKKKIYKYTIWKNIICSSNK